MKENSKYFTDIPDAAIGLLRFEIQMFSPKIRYLMRKYPELNHQSILRYLGEISRVEFSRYTVMLFATGRHYTLDTACELVKQAGFRKECRILEFLNAVSMSRSLADIIREYELIHQPYKGILKKLRKINVNPVTIPRRWGDFPLGLESVPEALGIMPPPIEPERS